jgi:DNA repair exonuclease SbcCD ATPase subunit
MKLIHAGRFGIDSADGGSSSSSKKPKAKPLCSPCARVHTAKLEALTAKHKAEVEQLQQSVKRLTVKLDAKLEAHVLAHRFRDREDELRKRNEALEQELGKAVRELREKRANFDTHMASTLRHKAIAKELASVKEQYEAAKTRLAEVERSVMQVCCCMDSLMNMFFGPSIFIHPVNILLFPQ